jgi:predicted SAM-dependent methyltransferase
MAREPIRLNIGSGPLAREGYISVDAIFGDDAAHLRFPNEYADEVMASHVLEHFGFGDVVAVLREWHRVLKPMGVIKIAVPNYEWIHAHAADPKSQWYLFGGQTDANDFHKSLYTTKSLENCLKAAGFENVEKWEGNQDDCSVLPVSLNLKAIKPVQAGLRANVVAVMSIPRYGNNAAWGAIMDACYALRLSIMRGSGAYWHQGLETMLTTAINKGYSLAVCIDHDSLFTANQLNQLINNAVRGGYDALAAVQAARGRNEILAGKDSGGAVLVDGNPIRVHTAHFGLTAIRLDKLANVPHPWFMPKPNTFGHWDKDNIDADIAFWHSWERAGNTLYVDPTIRIGHIEEIVRYHDVNCEIQLATVEQWKNQNGDDQT